ncbi:MAG: shikimate kinase [Flavobacteriaceae bacterium]|jgi:shikimate kinase|nr:shikimate kinase [Flavobacteriaceae bacterium]
MIISLVGYMGAGKTTVGKQLSERLQLPFADLDDYISSKEKMTVKEIFARKGEIYFRKLEKHYLEQLLQKDALVLSLGGGTPVYYDNMELINHHSNSFYLKLKPSELVRILAKKKAKRPLIAHLKDKELKEFIAKHLFERLPYYEKAQYKIDAGNKSPQEITEEIIEYIKSPSNS